jgi:hypothetical protein
MLGACGAVLTVATRVEKRVRVNFIAAGSQLMIESENVVHETVGNDSIADN